MWHLYLDESGDLGFDFVNKKPSKFFTICVLALSSTQRNRQLAKEVRLTLRRKLNPQGKRRRIVNELKGNSTTLEIKQYFYQRVQPIQFGLYSITLNKRRVYERLTHEKERVYNWISRKVLDAIPFEKAGTRVELIVDKSKGKPEIREFNSYIIGQLKARLDPQVPLDIHHRRSHEVPGLGAVDLFCWGIFQKHERGRTDWYDVFWEEKGRLDHLFLV